jgi:hypothetical protein
LLGSENGFTPHQPPLDSTAAIFVIGATYPLWRLGKGANQ